jgi:catechol 2,3-dioxygenase-like lactoylglutathione lyase family enzyme
MRVALWFVAVLAGCLLATRPARATNGSEDSAVVLHLRYVTVVVKDYDAALAWYTNVLGLRKLEDRTFGPGHRWLVVAPNGESGLGIVLSLADPRSMESPSLSKADSIGKESNWVFQVHDCRVFYDVLRKRGVHFIKPPADQPWGTVQAIFEDLYGNVFVAESAKLSAMPSNGQAVEPGNS